MLTHTAFKLWHEADTDVCVYGCVYVPSVFVVSMNDSFEKGLSLRLGSTSTKKLGVAGVVVALSVVTSDNSLPTSSLTEDFFKSI